MAISILDIAVVPRRQGALRGSSGENEHLIVEGKTGQLRDDFMHEDRKGVTDRIAKHNGDAKREAQELLNTRAAPSYQEIGARLFGTQAQRKRWRLSIWNRLPPLIRPFFIFSTAIY